MSGKPQSPFRLLLLGDGEQVRELRERLEGEPSWVIRQGQLEADLAHEEFLAQADVFVVRAEPGATRSLLSALNGLAHKIFLPGVLIESDHPFEDLIPEILHENLILQMTPLGLPAECFKRQVRQLAELRWSRAKLVEAQQAVEDARTEALQILRIVAHDMRGPMHSLRAFPQMIRLQFGDYLEEKGLEAAKDMENDVVRLHTGMEDLLHWSMVQLDDMTAMPQPVKLREISLQAIEFATDLIDKKHQIQNDLPEDQVVHADPDMLKIILRNLVVNALKFTPREGRITIGACRENGRTLLYVEDTGVGIPKAQQQRLFQLHKRVRARGTENEKGSGLGLILCRNMLRRQNGDLQISSVEGEGTRATIILPDPDCDSGEHEAGHTDHYHI